RRVREIANQYPGTRISVLAENEEQIRQWRGSDIGIFLDINPGMNRTGIERSARALVIELARMTRESQVEFRGLHYYDGQFGSVQEPELSKATHAGYDQLLELVADLNRSGVRVSEIITAGTPTFPSSLTYRGFRGGEFVHRVSPGTVVYHDATSLAQLPAEY